MARSGRQPDKRASAETGFHHRPFRNLEPPRAAPPAPPPSPPPPKEVPPSPVEDDAAAFLREMAGVRPIRGNEPPRVSPAAPEPASRAPQTDEAEVLAELSDLVAGQLGFDISQTTEYLQGHVVGLDPRLIRRLRDGELAFQAHLDLHGHTAAEARVALDRFLADAIGRGLRCVLVVHGRGLNSENRSPVLKKSVSTWLSQGTWARWVLAFTSARPCDGGLGALYVLLRRKREGKRPIRVLEGAGP